MKRLFQIAIVLFVCSAQAAEDRGLFWRVQSATATVYLLGSIHFADSSFYPLRSEIEQAFAGADHLVVEVNINALAVDEVKRLMQKDGSYQGDETIRDHISADTHTKLLAVLQQLGIPYALVERQKPGLLMMTLTSVQMMKMGFSPEQGIDAYFLARSEKLDKPVLELEGLAQQMRLILNMADDELLVQESLSSLEQIETSMQALVASWKRGDEAALKTLVFDEVLEQNPDYLPVYEQLFFRRNLAMAKKIQQYLAGKGRYFVVVGAGHLIGEQGIVHILETRGYTPARY